MNNIFTTPISLGISQAVITTLLSLVVVYIASKRGLNIKKEVLISLLRGIIQITAIGSVLLFFLKSPAWTSFIVLFIMFIVAGITASKRAKGINGAFNASFYGISLASIIVIGLMTFVGVIEYKVISLVPVGSMIIAAAMNSNALALNRFKSEIISHIGLIETALSLGASPKVSVQPYITAALHASLIPRIDSLRTLGIVWIPGLMTGMILTGTDPIYAAIYQFVVMGMIFATSGLSAIITIALIQKQVFSEAEQLMIYNN